MNTYLRPKNTQVVWKFPIAIVDEQVIEVPSGSRALSVIMQDAMPMLYCRVVANYDRTRKLRVFVHGTGHDIHPDATLFVGTIQVGLLVFHIFVE